MRNTRNGKFFAVLVVIGSIVCGCASTTRAGYFALGVGYGGEGNNESVSIEVGQKGIDLNRLDFQLGLGLPIIPYGDSNLPDGIIDGDCPNNDCVDNGTEYTGNELGLYGKIGLQLFLENFYLNIIGGGTVVNESSIVKSPATGRYYEESTESVWKVMYGAGLGYFPEIFDWEIVIQVDVDNRRGISGLVGFYW